MAALRRRALSRKLFEFPRNHAGLLKGVGGFVLAAGLISFAACLLSAGYRSVAIFPALLALFGYFLMYRAGRTILREGGIGFRGGLIEWSAFRGYEWCDDLKGRPSLRLKSERVIREEDLWIPGCPREEVDVVLRSCGIQPLYVAQPALV